MKYYILICAFMLITQSQIFAQMNESLTYRSQSEQFKRKSQAGNTIGGILLTSGLVLSYVGINNTLSNLNFLDKSKSRDGETAFIMGLTLALSSVPVFIIAAKNKRKSTLYLKQEKVQLPLPNTKINNTALVWRIPI